MERSPMRYFQYKILVAIVAIIAGVAFVAAQTQTQTKPQIKTQQQAKSPSTSQTQAQSKPQTRPSLSGFGSPPTQEDMGPLAWTAGPAGKDLPPGGGTAKQGAQIFAGRCAMCHGSDAEGVHWEPGTFSVLHGPRLGGGNGVPTYVRTPGQIVTLAYTAPTATAIFDTIAVEMPEFRAGTLTPDQVYSLTAFVLYKNGIVKEDDIMNRETLPKVLMPNRNTFPASDDVYLDMKKRGCYKTYGVCLGD
jgi:mono/diheme cytochrome c family protein